RFVIMYADTILRNGTFYTMDETHPKATTIAIKNGKIVALDEEAEQYKGPETTIQSMENKAVLPGFIESHAHPLHFAANLYKLDLRNEVTPDIESILNAVRQRAKEIPEGEWIIGMGRDDSKLKEKRNG